MLMRLTDAISDLYVVRVEVKQLVLTAVAGDDDPWRCNTISIQGAESFSAAVQQRNEESPLLGLDLSKCDIGAQGD